jgi:hypothetical protein
LTVRAGARAVLAVVAGLGAVVAGAPPASAHTVAGVAPTNYRSEVTDIVPDAGALHVRLFDLGRRIQLTNLGDEVVVLGYQGEPYLRIGPAGTFENRRSPTLYQNRVVTGSTSNTTLPPQADATAAPTWHRISTGHTATWRDQRTRWEGPDPVEVRQSPALTQVVVPHWAIQLRRGDAPVVIEGRITWVPGPHPWPWFAVAGALAAGCAALGLLRRWGPALAGVLALAIALDAVRTVGVAVGSSSSFGSVMVALLLGGLLSVAVWVIGVGTVNALQQQRHGGAMAAGGVGLFLAVYAAADASSLFRSQVPSAFPAEFTRLGIAGTLGMGVGLIGAAAIVERRLLRQLRNRPKPPAGTRR